MYIYHKNVTETPGNMTQTVQTHAQHRNYESGYSSVIKAVQLVRHTRSIWMSYTLPTYVLSRSPWDMARWSTYAICFDMH